MLHFWVGLAAFGGGTISALLSLFLMVAEPRIPKWVARSIFIVSITSSAAGLGLTIPYLLARGGGGAGGTAYLPPQLAKASSTLRLAYMSAQSSLTEFPLELKYPREIQLGESGEFEATIASSDLDKMRSNLADDLAEERNLKVELSNNVRADLSSIQGAKIEALDPLSRVITPLSNVTWRWRITPEQYKDISFQFVLFDKIKLNGVETEIDGPTEYIEIAVRSNLWKRFEYFVGAHGGPITWMVGTATALIGIIAVAVGMLRKPQRRA